MLTSRNGTSNVAKAHWPCCWCRAGTTVWTMNQLPAAYAEYLAGRDEDFIATVLPVLKQSVADKKHGVHVVINSHTVQARTDPEVPFGEVREGAID